MPQADRDATRRAFSKPAAFVLLTKGLTLKTPLTAADLREALHYDPLTGHITRRVDGSTATRAHSRGYLSLSVRGQTFLAHRVAWLLTTGEWPAYQVDHRNGMRADNRWQNLRDVTPSINYQNQRAAGSRNRSCGLLGVTWDKARSRWKASIQVDHKAVNLGRFGTPEAAHDAYLAAKRRLHPGCTI